MPGTTVVFVHGFNSSPDCWTPFVTRLEADTEVTSQGFTFLCYKYPTKLFEWKVTRRIPSIAECGAGLGNYLDNEVPDGQLMLVGHSMGGLVIQSYLAGKIGKGRAEDLQRIRSVIMFATPNRGSTIASSIRDLLGLDNFNDQEKGLRVLNTEISDMNDTIVRGLIEAQSVDDNKCPIPFRAFWGLEDAYVPKVSACGPFVEASPLPGNHTEIIRPDPKDPRDERYISLKNALLDPIGHPSIYEISRFDVNLCVSPNPPDKPIMTTWMDDPEEIYTDNIAVRDIRIEFSKQNRCYLPYEQMYRSIKGHVQWLSEDGTNLASKATQSEYQNTGKKYTFLFKPANERSYGVKLKIYNGFGDKQRSWHNHMNPNARYKLFTFTLDLKAYHDAGYEISPEPTLYMYANDNDDHQLCYLREPGSALAPVSAADTWLRRWEIANVRGGVIDIAWDVKKPAVLQQA